MSASKKAFSIIELIFVIVILGVLAAIGVPKLLASQEDAILVRIVSSYQSVIKDIQGYYVANGTLAGDVQAMSNVDITRHCEVPCPDCVPACDGNGPFRPSKKPELVSVISKDKDTRIDFYARRSRSDEYGKCQQSGEECPPPCLQIRFVKYQDKEISFAHSPSVANALLLVSIDADQSLQGPCRKASELVKSLIHDKPAWHDHSARIKSTDKIEGGIPGISQGAVSAYVYANQNGKSYALSPEECTQRRLIAKELCSVAGTLYLLANTVD